jgi:hypothetical protein
MTQPASSFLPRQLVRAVPFSSPDAIIDTLGAGLNTTIDFDVATALSDRNAIGGTNPLPLARMGTGFFLDVSVFMTQAGTLDVLFVVTGHTNLATVPANGTARSVMPGGTPVVVAANTLTLVAGLRVIATRVSIVLVNTAGVSANIEFFAAVRSG